MPNPTLLDIPTLALTRVLANATPSGAFEPGGVLYPETNSTQAGEFDFTYLIINVITVVFFVGIIAVMVYFAVRYRRNDANMQAEHTSHHNTALELGWSLPPLVIVLALFYLGFSGYWKLVTIPPNAYEIQVTAQKWNWLFIHPNGYQSTNLDVPAGRPVKLTMQSLDVIHSLFVPAFRVKKDVVPGRYSDLWFQAISPTDDADLPMPEGDELDKLAREELTRLVARALTGAAKDGSAPTKEAVDAEVERRWNEVGDDGKPLMTEAAKQGIYRKVLDEKAAKWGHQLYCTEFCGQKHSMMLAKVVVHKEGWTAPTPIPGTPAEEGEKLFKTRGCAGCHATEAGGPPTCPPFTNGIFGQQRTTNRGTVTADENYLRESIVSPLAQIVAGQQPQMPVIPMSDTQVNNLIAYLKTLGPQPAKGEKPAEPTQPEAEPKPEATEPAKPAADAGLADPFASAICADEEKEDDGEKEKPKDPLDDPKLIEQGKALFQTKICATCHAIVGGPPTPLGDVLKAPRFIGKFWGEKVTVIKGPPPATEEMEVVFNQPYVEESIAEPMKLIVKGSIAGMAPLPTTAEERIALAAYIKSLSKEAE